MKISNWKDKLLTFGLFAAVVAVMMIFQIPCPFKWLLHIECPGCGLTRAYLSLLRLDVQQAFAYNAMFWGIPIYGLWFLFDGKFFGRKWLGNVVFWAVTAGFFANWIIRLVCG